MWELFIAGALEPTGCCASCVQEGLKGEESIADHPNTMQMQGLSIGFRGFRV